MAATADWIDRWADAWGRVVVRGLRTPYPWNASHLSMGPDDVDVTPERLHPAFHGCLDWHSSAHMQWSAVTLLDEAGAGLGSRTEADLAAELDGRLRTGAIAVECEYLARRRGFERPYGWGWAALLAARCASSAHPHAPVWAQATAPLAGRIFTNVLDWLPRQVYPVRSGKHDNSAFGLGLCLDAARVLGRDDVVAAIGERAMEWFGADRDCPVVWEPGGSDFLSPALCEAHLMQRVLGPRFDGWLGGFLPELGYDGDPLLTVPQVLDDADGQFVHLFGLALSRAWQLRALARGEATGLDDAARERIEKAASTQIEAVERQIVDGDFMSTHWLVSFALQAVRA
ncbi:DUF2891 family protein [Acidipropionibacterium timonense]|uniref:DUF2891 family protein n=1 Tax=Acidipropionibacterium timonense TaxID=2161818 RepID=UPI0010313A49|nr:DUF2891 family protein [Acidipropionibacterium timonense]